MRDGIVYCRLHYEMLQQPPPTPTPSHSANGLILPHQIAHHHPPPPHHLNAINDGPCDLSCGGGASTGPHHGLLPPSGFHPHHPHSGGGGGLLSSPAESSLSPGGGGHHHHHQHMISILAAATAGGGVDPLDPSAISSGGYAGGIRCSSLFAPHHDPYNPSNDFQRFGSLLGNGSATGGFFPSSVTGNGSAVSPSSASSAVVQKGRPRKRKGPGGSQSAPQLGNNNNNNSSSNNNNNNNGSSSNGSSNHSDPNGVIGQQQLHNHLNAANLRQLGSIGELFFLFQNLKNRLVAWSDAMRFESFRIEHNVSSELITRRQESINCLLNNIGFLYTQNCNHCEDQSVCDGGNRKKLIFPSEKEKKRGTRNEFV